MEVKRIDIKEFREEGFLQEVNRQFFHPLGLALEIVVDDETGTESLGGIWDYRDDPEGIRYDEVDAQKAEKIEVLQRVRAGIRYAALGYVIQPINVTAKAQSAYCCEGNGRPCANTFRR